MVSIESPPYPVLKEGRVDPIDVAATVRRAADGDRAAWDALVEAFTPFLFAVASTFRLGSADTAEVVQTTWLRLVEHLDAIHQPEAVGGWLATTARREALRLVRTRSREQLIDDVDIVAGPPSGGPSDPEQHAIDADRRRLLRRAFGRLPDNCQVLLHLLTVGVLSYAEIAAQLEMPIGSIGPTRGRCLDRLRRLVTELGVVA
jgi:RNA polymerase sigma factor (sigma-70 family)